MAKTKTSGTKLTREQLINFLQRKEEESDTTPYVMKALFGDELSLVTETHARMIVPIIRLHLLLAAADPDREKPLIQVFLETRDKVMVSFERKGRLEALGALQALAAEGEEERAIGMSR